MGGVTCYHEAMRSELDRRGEGYLYPEEYRWFLEFNGKSLPNCEEGPCIHWPIFTVVPGSPYPSYHGEPEVYAGFRSEPRPLMGEMKLHSDEKLAEIASTQEYLRGRLKWAA